MMVQNPFICDMINNKCHLECPHVIPGACMSSFSVAKDLKA